jgi:hypothetical protein
MRAGGTPRRGPLFFEGVKLLRQSATWQRLTAHKVETPAPDTWLTEREAELFCGRDLADIKRVPFRTRREKNGHRTKTFYPANDLRQVFRIRNAAMKLALLEASPHQLRCELASSTDPEIMRYISEAIALRRAELIY